MSWRKRFGNQTESYNDDKAYDHSSFLNDSNVSSYDFDLAEHLRTAKLHDETENEARSLVTQWINQDLRNEIMDDGYADITKKVLKAKRKEQTSNSMYNDCDKFMENVLNRYVPQPSLPEDADILEDLDLSNDDDSVITSTIVKRLMNKPTNITVSPKTQNRFSKKSYNPSLAMELRHKEIKEKHRLRKLKNNEVENAIKQQECEKMARKLRARQRKELAHIEEKAIQDEMERIRRRMREEEQAELEEIEKRIRSSETVSKKSEKILQNSEFRTETNLNLKKLTVITNPPMNENKNKKILKERFKVSKEKKSQIQILEEREHNLRIARINVEKMLDQKLLKKYFSLWFQVVLEKQTFLGKAKALADWHCISKTWNAWRLYRLKQEALEETEVYKTTIKIAKKNEHLARKKHRVFLLRKFFLAWRKFVKVEQYCGEIQQQHKETKDKMASLLLTVTNAVNKKAKNDVVVKSFEGDWSDEEEDSEIIDALFGDKTFKKLPPKTQQRNKLKNAWQVRKSDVDKLSVNEMLEMNPAETSTVVTPIHPDRKRSKVENQNLLIAQQRQLINKQKQIINEQKKTIHSEPNSSRLDVNEGELNRSVKFSKKNEVKHAADVKPPRSLMMMEKRAMERNKRRREIEEKRRNAEKERIGELQRKEEERLKEEAEEKRRKIEEIKLKKKLKEEALKRKAEFAAHMKLLNQKADDHYTKNLLLKYGLEPWLRLMINSKTQLEVADIHYSKIITRKCIFEWNDLTQSAQKVRKQLADDFYKKYLVRMAIRNWLRYGESMTILEQKAEIHHNFVIKRKYLRVWERYATNERMSYFEKCDLAKAHDLKRLKRRGFNVIKSLRDEAQRNEERARRVQSMRKKVAELIPDFFPQQSLQD